MLLMVQGLSCGPALAQPLTAAQMSNRYQTLRPQLLASPLGAPVLVSSVEEGDLVRGEIHALLGQAFDGLVATLSQPREWCPIVLLHLNVKTCTHERGGGMDWLTVYNGRKVYEPPEKAKPLRFAFSPVSTGTGFLDVELRAPSGPLNTQDHQISLLAIPIPEGSFVHVSYAYRSSSVSRLATNLYLATIGRDKVGFTVVGTGRDGNPEYVGGKRGIAERNALRYYFAVQAGLEAASLPPPQRLETALARWFALTERHPLQLHELDWPDYLQGKRKENEEQLKHQQALDAAAARPPPALGQQ